MNLKIEYVPIDSVTPYEGNAKTHPAEQIEQIKASIREFGMNDPIAVWHGVVVEGHGRLIACHELEMETIPIIRLDDLTDEQRRAYTILHNQATMNSPFDMYLLNMELEELKDIDISGLSMSDFNLKISEKNIDALNESPEDFPEYSDETKTTYKCPRCGYEWK